MEDVEGEYFTLYFCTKDSLQEFIATLQEALEAWEKGGKSDERPIAATSASSIRAGSSIWSANPRQRHQKSIQPFFGHGSR